MQPATTRRLWHTLVLLLAPVFWACAQETPLERTLRLEDLNHKPALLKADTGDSGQFTWWLPAGADDYILPFSGGLLVNGADLELTSWLQRNSPWDISELPAFGVRYGSRQIVVILPWPQYAQLVVTNRVGVRFEFPEGRHGVTPCEIVVMERGPDQLEVARAFREWRQSSPQTGGIPRPRPLTKKAEDLNRVERLFGAPHFYLWGPALFSRHDVPGSNWLAFARGLRDAPPNSLGARAVGLFPAAQRDALRELAEAQWPMASLTVGVAASIDALLADRRWLELPAKVPAVEVVRRNRSALAAAFAEFVAPQDSWGDGLSSSLLKSLQAAGISRALLVLSDLYGRSPRPEVVALADQLGYLLGPYDSYHSIHSPDAGPDNTWETAQFDRTAYESGRILKADGSGRSGFKGRGYYFSPKAAWPYVQKRVGGILEQTPFSAWFVDCDATAECFDDYSTGHRATRVDDINSRRQRLSWLETEHRLVVGSEGGSALFADVIHFGHGVQTPYLGHLDPAFRDPKSPHFLGRHWPPDGPQQSFQPVPVPPSLRKPYFDPAVRIPLHRAALGDEVVATHHWSFDSLKLSDVSTVRELLEISTMSPPMYHLNREHWPKRRRQILRHLAFWGPLHRELASAPLTRFECLTDDRLVQRTTFSSRKGPVTITVNFGERAQAGFPPHSATVGGSISVPQTIYRAGDGA